MSQGNDVGIRGGSPGERDLIFLIPGNRQGMGCKASGEEHQHIKSQAKPTSCPAGDPLSSQCEMLFRLVLMP